MLVGEVICACPCAIDAVLQVDDSWGHALALSGWEYTGDLEASADVESRRVGGDCIADVTRTGETEVCVVLLLEDVEEGVEKSIMFLCLQRDTTHEAGVSNLRVEEGVLRSRNGERGVRAPQWRDPSVGV